MNLPNLLASIMLVALVLYALLGGADYGGGVWDLLARGPRAAAQRALIAEAKIGRASCRERVYVLV